MTETGGPLPFFVGGPVGVASRRWESYRAAHPGFDFHFAEDPSCLVGFLCGAARSGADYAVACLDPVLALPDGGESLVADAIRHAESLVDRFLMLASGGVTPGLEAIDYGFYTGAPSVAVSGDLTPCLAPFPQLQVWGLKAFAAGGLDRLPEAGRSDVVAVWAALGNGLPSFVSPWLRFGRPDRPAPRRSDGPAALAVFVASNLEDHEPGTLRLLEALGGNDPPSLAALADRPRLLQAIAAAGLEARAWRAVRGSRPDARISVVMRTGLSRPRLMRRALASLALAAASSPLHEVLLSAEDRPAVERLLPVLQREFPGLPLRAVTTQLPAVPSMTANLIAGARATTGDYVWFLDDDDIAAPHSLAAIQAAVYTRYYPMLIGRCNVYRETWADVEGPAARIEHFGQTRSYDPTGWVTALGGDNPVPLCAVVYPRPLLLRIAQESRLRGDLNEDYAVLLLALNDSEAEVRVIPGDLAAISQRVGPSADNWTVTSGGEAKAAAVGNLMARILSPGAGYRVALAQMGSRTAELARENAVLRARVARSARRGSAASRGSASLGSGVGGARGGAGPSAGSQEQRNRAAGSRVASAAPDVPDAEDGQPVRRLLRHLRRGPGPE